MSETGRDTRPETTVEAPNDEAAAPSVIEDVEAEEGRATAEAPTAEGEDAATQTAALQAQLVAARRQADEYLDQWRRTAAEFQNFRKRQERERQELIRNANAQLLMRLLPVLDDLQRAAQHVPEELRDNEWVNGVLIIERKLWAVLEQAGVQPIAAEAGQSFDPHLHDAVVAEPSETVPSGHIIGELERGYKLHDKVLRPAKVRVAR